MTNAEFRFITETTVCRCCGVEKPMGVNLYGPDSVRSNILLKTMALLPKEVIHIEGDDDLPKFVCSDCEMTLNHFSEFCEMVKKVQKTFKTQRLALVSRKPNVEVGEDVNQCHTSGVSKDKEPVTISVGADGKIRCESCNTYLEVVQLSVLHMVTHGLGTVFCCCRECGHRDEVGNFLQNKLDTVQCPQCLFLKKADNSTTNKTTEVKRNHICEICSKTFRSKSHCDRHKMTHNGAKPFLCETCGTGFNQKKTLKLHMLSHSGINPHVCQWCGQSFRFKESLRSHILNVHSLISEVETKFECDRCNKQFATGYKLRRHYRSHTGARPYQCPTCDKFFSQTGNLKAHLKKHKTDSSFSNTYETEQLLESSAQKLLGTMFDSECQQSSLHSSSKEYLSLEQTNASYALVSGDASKHTSAEDDMFSDFNPQEVLFADQSHMMQMTNSAGPHHMENSASVVLPTFSSLHSASNDISL